MKQSVIFLCCLITVLTIGCTRDIGDDIDNPAIPDPEGTVTLDMAQPIAKIDNTISVVEGNFTGAIFVTLGKVKGLAEVTSIPKTGWVSKLAAVKGHGYIAYSPSKRIYYRLYVSMYDDLGALGTRIIVKYQYPFLGSEKEIKSKSATITLTGTEAQTIEFTNNTLFPFSYSFENNEWCNASYSRTPDETMPYNSIKINARGNNPELTPRECTLVLKSDIGKDINIKIVQAAGSGNISVSHPQITFSSTNTQDVQVYSNTEWSAVSNASWCSISPAFGIKNGTITISVTPNTSGTQRNAIVTLTTKDGKIKTEIAVIQPTASISLSRYEISFLASASIFYIDVFSNNPWTASSNQAWCTVTNQNNMLLVSVTENQTNEDRNAVVAVAITPELKATVKITQAKPTLSLSTSSLSFNAPVASSSFKVTTNTAWEVNSNQSWCTVIKSGNTVNVTVSENLSGTDRNAIITVTLPGNQSATVSVTQAKPILTLSKNDISFTAVAASNSFMANSNVSSWEVNSNQSWCTVVKSGNTVNVSVTENLSGTDRNAIITVTILGNQIGTVTVTQAKPTLSVPESIPITAVAASYSFTVNTNASTWEISSNQTWCTATRNGNIAIVTVTENQSTEDKSATVTITLPDKQKATVNISQSKPMLSLSTTEINFAKTPASSTTISVWSNVSSWTSVSSNQSWCTVTKNGNTVVVSATPNNSGSIRQATVMILYQIVTITQDAYQVGDYYNVGGVQGVVFTMTGQGHGKIVSMDETTAQWATGSSVTGAGSISDGIANMNIIKTFANWNTLFPAFVWCDEKNTGNITGWYLPIIGEWLIISSQIAVINLSMQQNGGININGQYWSSIEASAAYAQTSSGYSSGVEKIASIKVRAVKAF